MRQAVIRTDWIPRNEYTTPLKGVITSRNAGVIKAVGQHGEKYSIGKIEYQHFEDESFQYIISPFWDVIDGLSGKVFQGIPGIKMELRLVHYYRANYTPVFITERTPSSEREDMWELMESVGLDYFDRLEWLIRTPLRAGNDNLIVQRWRDTPLRVGYGKANEFHSVDNVVSGDLGKLLDMLQYGDTVILDSLQSLSSSAAGLNDALVRMLGAGVNIESVEEGRVIRVADISVLLPVVTAQWKLYLSSRKAKQTEGIANAKKQGKYKGRKKLPVDELAFRSVYERVRYGSITVDTAMKELGIPSRSTYYRRARELEENNTV